MSEMGIFRQPPYGAILGIIISTMKVHENSPIVRPYGRLKLVGAGLALAVVGCALVLRDIQVVTHWTGQPMFSWALIGGGAICILFAGVPASWIEKATALPSKRRERGL